MNRLKEIRKEQGKTQKELATLLGVTEMTISRWENMEELSIKHEQAQRLAEYFGVSDSYLLGYSDFKTPMETLLAAKEDLKEENETINSQLSNVSDNYERIKSNILATLEILKEVSVSNGYHSVVLNSLESLEKLVNALDENIKARLELEEVLASNLKFEYQLRSYEKRLNTPDN